MMHYYSRIYSTAFLLLISLLSKAQIQVSFPISRAVLQRNNANQATLRITGNYTASVTRVEARLQARDGQGVSTDWGSIQNSPTGGIYAGDLTGTGGWYDLQVRGMNGDQQVGNVTTVERVGIGEVFVVAGQSNAQGVHQNAPNPGNDRVNCVNYYYNHTYPTDPPKPVFTKLDNYQGFSMAPIGVGSWCWGQLGDLLVKRLNVPVMFFNAAFSGTAVRNWRESAPEGGTAYGIYNGQPYNTREPYINLKVALQFYVNTLGVRAVLWHQGEADNLIDTPLNAYIYDLGFVINQTRQDYNQKLSWVVARASYGDFIGLSDQVILNAQNQVITSVGNVFAGPQTDNIQVPRKRPPLNDLEGLHFDYDGLVEVANAWNTSLNDSFFQNSTPVSPALSPTVSVECAGNNLKLSVNGNYPTVQWDSGESGSTITKGPGTYQAKIKDGAGNTFYSAQIQVAASPVASVVDNKPPSVCTGSSLALTSSYAGVTWLSQSTNAVVAAGQTFTTNSAGVYYVRYKDVSGCDFTSNAITVTVNPLPATPIVSNDKVTTFCQGDNTVLRASSDNVQYNWSDGQKNKVVTVGASGSYFLTVTDQNGCTSNKSNTISVTANPTPAKPVIVANGATTFCADRNVTLTAPEEVAYLWKSGQTSRSITLNQSGDFSVQIRNQFGCTSVPSDIVTIKVNPLPAIPSVSAAGSTTFCEGKQVTLNATSPVSVVWSSGQTDKSITVSMSGNYGVQARDQNGCLSPFSSIISVKANPLPATPTIQATPSPIICEGDKALLRISGPYTVFWSTGDSTQQISTGTAGTYTAKVRDGNGCISAQAGTITVETRPLPPSPTIQMIGTYTLQAVSSTNGTQFRWRRGTDSLATESAIIKANQSGTYTARSSIIYSTSLTCFSLPSSPFTFTADETNKGLSIYPNPNPDKILTLETQANLTNAIISLYSLTGQRVLTTTVPVFDERKQLVLTGLPSGYYVLRVQSAGYDVSKRIVLGL